jgi:hypothetical protein
VCGIPVSEELRRPTREPPASDTLQHSPCLGTFVGNVNLRLGESTQEILKRPHVEDPVAAGIDGGRVDIELVDGVSNAYPTSW